MLSCGSCGVRAGVTLIDVGDLNGVAGYLLNLYCQFGHLLAVTLNGWCDGERQQEAQRVAGDMGFRPLPPRGTVIAGPFATLRRRLQGTAVETDCRTLALCARPMCIQLTAHPLPEPRNKPHRSSAASADTPRVAPLEDSRFLLLKRDLRRFDDPEEEPHRLTVQEATDSFVLDQLVQTLSSSDANRDSTKARRDCNANKYSRRDIEKSGSP